MENEKNGWDEAVMRRALYDERKTKNGEKQRRAQNVMKKRKSIYMKNCVGSRDADDAEC